MIEAAQALLDAPFIRFLIVLLAVTVIVGAFTNRESS